MIDERVEKWLQKALNDLEAAKHLLKVSPPEEIVTEAVCFHSQQAVEKFLKAFLTSYNIPFGRTHHLEYIVNLASKVEASILSFLEDMKKLAPYAVEVRYPDDFYEPTLKETKEVYEIALKVKKFVLQKIGQNRK